MRIAPEPQFQRLLEELEPQKVIRWRWRSGVTLTSPRCFRTRSAGDTPVFGRGRRHPRGAYPARSMHALPLRLQSRRPFAAEHRPLSPLRRSCLGLVGSRGNLHRPWLSATDSKWGRGFVDHSMCLPHTHPAFADGLKDYLPGVHGSDDVSIDICHGIAGDFEGERPARRVSIILAQSLEIIAI